MRRIASGWYQWIAAGCCGLAACADSSLTERNGGAAADSVARAIMWDSSFGIVTTRNDTVCLHTLNSAVSAASELIVVLPDKHRVLPGTVGAPLATCPNQSSEPAHTFQVSVPGFTAGDLGIAVLLAKPPVLNGVDTDLNRDGIAESYRTCTSSEGVHLTVWAGPPLRSLRLWHGYHYLGYDVEPTCTEADGAASVRN